jgi:peroxiredoxin
MDKGLECNIAPYFSLIDTDDKTIHLSDYKDKKHVILVFNRGPG